MRIDSSGNVGIGTASPVAGLEVEKSINGDWAVKGYNSRASNGYGVIMEPNAISYTKVPDTFGTVWIQRLRWSRGYVYNMWKYRDMLFASKHGLLGTFQLPVNVVAVLLLILNVSLISYDGISRLLDFSIRSFTIPDYFWTSVMSFPSLQEFLLARNVQVSLPIIISLMLGIYLIVIAHRLFNEKLKNNVFPLVAYMFVMPYFSTLNWASAITKEVRRQKARCYKRVQGSNMGL